MNTVSIIVPIYNAEKYIRRCIFSLLNQTHKEIEIILINDGSIDRTGEICDDYAQRYTNIHTYHQKNAGPSSARNLGICHATGTYIQFVDADDTIKAQMTEKLVSAMDTGIDLAICGFETTKHTFAPTQTGLFPHQAIFEHIGELYSGIILPSLCNKMYRKSIIENYNIELLQTCSFGEDLLFNLDYLQVCGNVHIYPYTFYEYRRNEDSLTNSYIYDMFYNHKILHQRIINFLKGNNCYDGKNKQYVNTIFASGIIQSLTNLFHQKSNLTRTERNEYIERIIGDTTVIRQLPYFTNNFQAKMLRTLIQKQTSLGTYTFLRTKEIFRHRFHPFFQMLQKWNGTGY